MKNSELLQRSHNQRHELHNPILETASKNPQILYQGFSCFSDIKKEPDEKHFIIYINYQHFKVSFILESPLEHDPTYTSI